MPQCGVFRSCMIQLRSHVRVYIYVRSIVNLNSIGPMSGLLFTLYDYFPLVSEFYHGDM